MDKYPSFIQFLASNPWVLAFTFILTIVSFLFSIYTYQKQKKVKRPTFYIRTFGILSSHLNKTVSSLQIFYKSKEIKSLSITRIVFLNRGNEIINQSDVSSKEPLRISLDSNLEVFEAKVIYAKNQSANGFNILHNGSEIHFQFDYLAKDEGGVVQIVHTGSTAKDVVIKGNIKGVDNNILSILETYYSEILNKYTNVTLGILASLTMVIPIVLIKLFVTNDKIVISLILGIMVLISWTFTTLLHFKGIDSSLPKEYKSIIEQPWQI